MSVQSAWIVWDHHEGMDVRDDGSGLTAQEKMAKAFQAGWESAGGDQRLEAVADETGVAGHPGAVYVGDNHAGRHALLGGVIDETAHDSQVRVFVLVGHLKLHARHG